MDNVEQWNIDTDGLRVGGELWNGTRGWFVIVRLESGRVWVRPAGVKPSPGAQPLRARALTEGEVAQLKHGADRSDALFALNVLRKFCHMHGIVLTDWDGNDASGVKEDERGR